jgi:hypothetical protein
MFGLKPKKTPEEREARAFLSNNPLRKIFIRFKRKEKNLLHRKKGGFVSAEELQDYLNANKIYLSRKNIDVVWKFSLPRKKRAEQFDKTCKANPRKFSKKEEKQINSIYNRIESILGKKLADKLIKRVKANMLARKIAVFNFVRGSPLLPWQMRKTNTMEPGIEDKIVDGICFGIEKATDILCAPFEWMTYKISGL